MFLTQNFDSGFLDDVLVSFTPQLSFYTNVLGLAILHASACYHQSYVNTCIVMYM